MDASESMYTSKTEIPWAVHWVVGNILIFRARIPKHLWSFEFPVGFISVATDFLPI